MRLKSDIKSYYNQIKAGSELKIRAKDYLCAKTNGFSEYKNHKYYNTPFKLCAACFIIIVFGTILFFTPTAEIGLDINPSVELIVNSFNTVIDTKGLNEDGDKLLSSLDLRFKSYKTAFDEIVSDSTVKALLDKDEILSVTISGINAGQTKGIYERIESCSNAGVRCGYVPAEEYRAAHNLGMPCGKYRAYLYLTEIGCEITADEIKNMKMKDIKGLISDYSKGVSDNQTPPFCLGGSEKQAD